MSAVPKQTETTHIEKKRESFLSGWFPAGLIQYVLRLSLYISDWVPALSIPFNLNWIKKSLPELNNLGVEFPVPGTKKGLAYWFVEAKDRTRDDPVILYFHGGGYTWGFFPIFPLFWADICTRLNNDRLSVLMVDYTLSKEQKFPFQLKEAAKCYNLLAQTSNNVILVGDSAGAHLSLSLTRHIKYPVEGVDPVYKKPAAEILLSPWLNMLPDEKRDGGAYIKNKSVDYMNASNVCLQGKWALGDKHPLDSPVVKLYQDTEADWQDLLPKDVFVTIGECEVFRSEIEEFANMAKIPDERVYLDLDAVHDAAFKPSGADAVRAAVAGFLKEIL